MIIRLIHGIHSPEGNNNMSAFAPSVQRVMPHAHVHVFSYGFMGFWRARIANASVARRLADVHNVSKNNEPEVWITHSNGHAVAYIACRDYGARPDGIIAFNPALDRWRTPQGPFVDVIYSKQDRVVDLAQWLPWHLWGDQGKVGFVPEAPRYMPWVKPDDGSRTISHNVDDFGDDMAYEGHTGAFDKSRRDKWAAFVALRIEERLGVSGFKPVA